MITAEKSPMALAQLKVDQAQELSSAPERTFSVASIPLDKVFPIDGRAWEQANPNPKATYLKDWNKILMRIEAGEKLPPLLVEQTGDQYVMHPTPLGGDLGNSLALLTALRAAGKRQWPATLVTEPVRKDDTDIPDVPSEDDYTAEGENFKLDEEQKKKLKSDLKDWAEAVIAAIMLASSNWVPELAWEGADWGGGSSSPSDVVQTAQDVVQFQQDHADGFADDISGRIEEVLQASYGDATEFQDALDSMFSWAANRAELYATAGGNKAWFDGMMSSMDASGTTGGIWVCTFGPGSCHDCMALHGQFLTREELADTKGNTACNGACNCGIVPANSPDDLSPDELTLIDQNPGEGF